MPSEVAPLAGANLSTLGDIRRALHPLQAQADRVGRQVEEFAETLDRLSAFRHDDRHDCSQVLPLVQRFEKIAQDTVTRLKRRHAEEKETLLRERRRRKIAHNPSSGTLATYDNGSKQDTATGTSVHDLLQWEDERQTWELFGLLLQVHHPLHEAAMIEDFTPLERPRELRAHQFSSERAIYENYLAVDNAAWERHVVLEWLQRCANESGESIEGIIADSGRGDGSDDSSITTNGWLYTREKIKGDKRLHSLAYSMQPEQMDLAKSIMTSSNSKPMVTQLDPDAVTRQGRDLIREDIVVEHALWLGCWELLRRGKSWDEIQDWCEQRQESWRAVSMGGDPRFGSSRDIVASSLSSRAVWQQVCLRLAQGGGTNAYERATFGLLGGDEQSALCVSKTWNDQIHGFLNTQLVQGFNAYFTQKFKLSPPSLQSDVAELLRRSLTAFLNKLAETQAFVEQALTPFNCLQAALIQNLPAPHLRNQGLEILPQLQNTQYAGLNLKISQQNAEIKDGLTSPISLRDHDMLRILCHIFIIYQFLNPDDFDSPAMENIVVAYIDFLGKAGKQQLLPLYASFLSEDRAATALARQLPFIKDTTERQTIIRLMDKYGIEDEVVLLMQLDSITLSSPASPEFEHDFPRLELFDESGANSKEIRPLKRDLAGTELDTWQDDLIDSLEWFLLLGGDRKSLIYPAGIIAYKHLLRTRSYAAVRQLARQINSQRVAEIVGSPKLSNGSSGEDLYLNANGTDAEIDDLATSQLRTQYDREREEADVRVFRDLESLAAALDALDSWEQVVHAGTRARVQAHDGDKSALKLWKKDLDVAHNDVVDRMQPLLQGWLLPPRGKTEEEMKELRRMRVCMLPDLVLAYLSVLSFAGTWMNRENLLTCMNLAKEIADEDNGDLCRVFVDAGRMAELMLTMANISRQILAAQETTGGHKMIKKRRGGGELLDIWSINAESEG